MTPLEKKLLKALKTALQEWRTQTRLAMTIGGEIAVNEKNGPAFTLAERAIAEAESRFTEGRCEHKKAPGGCQLHNLHCGYPDCDRKPVAAEGR